MTTKRLLLIIFLLILAVTLTANLLAARTAQTTTLRIGVFDSLPMQSFDDKGDPYGLVIDLFDHVAEQERWNLTYVRCEIVECQEMLESGEVDLVGGLAFTEERSQRFDFTLEPLLTNWGVVCVQPGSGIDSILDLEGKKVAIIRDDIHTGAFQNLISEFGINVEYVNANENQQVFEWVQDGNADAGVVSRLFAVHHYYKYDLTQSTIIFNPTEIRIAATKGKFISELKALDEYLLTLKADQTSLYYQSLDRWMSSPTHGDNLPTWVGWALSFTGWAIALSVIAIISLRRQIKARTLQLAEGNEQLKREIEEKQKAEQSLLTMNEQLEARVRERTALLEASNQELERFAYSISHDLRAPLRAIEAYSEILMNEYFDDLDEEAQLFQARVRSNALLLNDLIDSLRAYSRLSHLPMTREEIDLSVLARQVIDEGEWNLDGREANFIVKDMPAIEADRTLMTTVYYHLISNAIKFTAERKLVEIKIGSRDEGGETVYYVEDNGVGFDMSQADSIFKVFQRLHGVEDYQGSGVGLAIVQRIIHRHNGRIWADAEEGMGATFLFTIGEGEEQPILISRQR